MQREGDATQQDDELLLTEEVEQDTALDEEQSGDDGADEPGQDDEEEEVFSFGDEPTDPQEGDSGLVKHLREEVKRARREAAEARKSTPAEEPVEIGEKPTIESCGFDEDAYDEAMEAWRGRKAAVEQQRSRATDADEAERAAWEQELTRVQTEKLQLGVGDADEAFETVTASLNTMQQAVIVKATETGNTARLIYTLGKHPDKLAELAAIDDPLRLAAKIAKLEGQLRVVKRRRAPDPDTPERGSARVSTTAADKKLEKLEKQAEQTGDRTELQRYRKKLQTVRK